MFRTIMLLVSSYYVIGQSVNTTLIAGVFRAGGDTRFGMLCDTVNMWCIAVPLGFFAAFVLKWPLKAVYVVLCLDEQNARGERRLASRGQRPCWPVFCAYIH